MNDLIGRRFRFERSETGQLVPVKELPSATWFHPDGQVSSVSVLCVGCGSPSATLISGSEPYCEDCRQAQEAEIEYVSPVFAILDSILALNSDERLIFLNELRHSVCLHCGNPDPRCQCSNDE